jgi:hypothetical protein
MKIFSTYGYSGTIEKWNIFFNKNIYMRFLATIIFLVFSSSFVLSQTNYTINFSDTSTYEVTCGKVVPSQWSVKNDSCILYTPYLRVESSGVTNIVFSIKINQSGNGETSDRAYVFHSVDEGSWLLDTLITAGGNPAVYTYYDSISLNYSHYIRFMIAMRTNAKTEFWAIKNAEILVSNVISYSSRPATPSLDDHSLPVELMHFTSVPLGNIVEINWATASETNNDFYTIEKSMDNLNFFQLGYLKGAGNSNTTINYVFKDADPLNGINYYRLMQTDFDGKTNDVGLTWCNLNTNISIDDPIIIYSEVDGSVYISINSLKDQLISVSIYDLNGNVLLSENHELIKGLNQVSIKPTLVSISLIILKVDTSEQSFYAKLNVI